LLSRGRDTVEFLSDCARRCGSDALELLKPASDSPELTNGLDVLSMEHVPGKLRQMETLNRSLAGFKMTRHLLLLSLAGGSARISQSPAPGSPMPVIRVNGFGITRFRSALGEGPIAMKADRKDALAPAGAATLAIEV
jgi:hypothetical protein